MPRKKTRRKAAPRRRSKRTIVLQFPKTRNPKKRRPKKRRRRNPVGAATVVNPRARKRRRRRRNPGVMAMTVTKAKDLLKPQVILPVVVGGGLGVITIAAYQKWASPRIPPKFAPFIKLAIGVVGLPAVNRLMKGAGPYFTGFMAGSALADWITPLLPWGEMGDWADDEADAVSELLEDDVDGLGWPEFVGDLDEDDQEDLGDAAAGGDDGTEEMIRDTDGKVYLVDGLGILPPFGPLPRWPGGMVKMMRRKRLLWMRRLRIPQAEVAQVMRLPKRARHAAIAKLRTSYRAKRAASHKAKGAPYADHRMVRRHPIRHRRKPHLRRRAPGTRVTEPGRGPRKERGRPRKRGMHREARARGARRVHRPKRGGKFGEMEEELDITGLGLF